MTRNQRTTYDPTASYGINDSSRWHNWPDPPRDDAEAEGLPLPATVDTTASFSVPRREVRR